MVETETEKLQGIIDKAKTISLLSNIHNLTPPVKKEDNDSYQITIVEALKSSPRLKDMFLELRGQEYDPITKRIEQVSRPIMNFDGAYRFVKICKRIAEEVEWSNYHEDEICSRIWAIYEENFPYFTLWSEDYELVPSDFNYIGTMLIVFIDSSFHKAKGGKYLNVVGKTYSEDFLGRTLQGAKQQERESILSKINPFKRK